MNHSAKRQHHEKARKEHRHKMQEHAREVAKKKPSSIPRLFLVIGFVCIFGFLIAVAIR